MNARVLPVAALWCFAGSAAFGAPARFWISTSPSSAGIEAPSINAAIGRTRTLYIWGRPATDNLGVRRTLQDFSLDVVTRTASLGTEPAPFIDFLDGSFTVYNDVVTDGKRRFQFTTDSQRLDSQGGALASERTSFQVLAGQPDAIIGLQGLSPLSVAEVVGVGHVDDPYNDAASNAWLIAKFSFKALQSSGVNRLFLQIGWAGMRHQGSEPTQVVFGNGVAPIYTAGPSVIERQTSLPGETYDILINAVPYSVGDFDGDGEIGPHDFSYWKDTFGLSVPAGDGADGNGNGIVDAADYVVWRDRVSAQSAASRASGLHSIDGYTGIVPEPTAIALVLVFSLALACPVRRTRI